MVSSDITPSEYRVTYSSFLVEVISFTIKAKTIPLGLVWSY